MTFDECLEEIKRESPEARKCIEIAGGIADIMYKEDYVKVVRCKDCKHRPEVEEEYINGFDIKFPDYVCPCQCDDGFYNWMPKDYWFCADGERRENNDRT